MRPPEPLEIKSSLTVLDIGLNNSTEKKFNYATKKKKRRKKKLLLNMSGCVQSALKHFITKKIKSLQCNGDDGKRRMSATVKCISQNSYPFRNLNFHKMGLGIRGLGPSFLPRSAGDLQRGISFPVLALCDPPLAPHSRSHPAANANSIPPSFWTEELELFFFGSQSPARSIT